MKHGGFLMRCLIVTLAVAGDFPQPIFAKKSATLRTIIRIEEFQNCQDRPNTTEYRKNHNYLSKVNIQRVKTDQYINADYVVNRPVDTLQAVANILKCEGLEETTCEHLMRLKFPLCDKLAEKGQMWSPLIQSLQPPCRCPLNKPLYKVVNGSFSALAAMPYMNAVPMGSDYYWGIKFTYPDPKTNTEASCLHVVFKFYKVRN